MGMRIKQGKEEFMRRIAVVAIALAVSGLTVPAQASGVGSTGAIPEFNGNGGGIDARQIREFERLFRKGRSQVRRHITCKKCEFHKNLNKNTALEVAQRVINGRYDIKEEDKTAVLVYLRDRYHL